MIIGYDGKRAFQNKTGLGNYSRSLITILTRFFPTQHYILFAPKTTPLFDTTTISPVTTVTPGSFFYKKFAALWRRRAIVRELEQNNVDIFHGLSNELPQGLQHTTIKAVVTIHDLVFERFPGTYNFDERYVHRWKIQHACKTADLVIAISNQTRNDLVDLYHIAPEKIRTVYQSCNPIFEDMVSEAERSSIRKKYALPIRYFLFVSSIAPRKNLVAVCKALVLIKDLTTTPLVVIGDGKADKEAAKAIMLENGIPERLIILNELPEAKDPGFVNGVDFPAIYQQAVALIYPSVFEGFGLPLLEALWSNIPVISSNTSSLPEVGGDAALYFDPHDHQLLAKHMMAVLTDTALVEQMRAKGMEQAQKFNTASYAENIMNVYKSLS